MTNLAADTGQPPPRTKLGVGRIMGDTFSIFFRKLPVILLIGFLPALLEELMGVAFTVALRPSIVQNNQGNTIFLTLGLLAVTVLVASIITAAIVQLAYGVRLGRPARVGPCFAAAIANLPAIFVLSIIVGVIVLLFWLLLVGASTFVGMLVSSPRFPILPLIAVAFLIPGVWLYSVFSVMVPAIVIDGAGFRALGRSASLTKGYRWPIVGTITLVVLCMILLAVVFMALMFVSLAALSAAAPIASVLLNALVSALTYGFFGVATALIFARLKEIKEGVSVADLVDVFR